MKGNSLAATQQVQDTGEDNRMKPSPGISRVERSGPENLNYLSQFLETWHTVYCHIKLPFDAKYPEPLVPGTTFQETEDSFQPVVISISTVKTNENTHTNTNTLLSTINVKINK